MLQQCWQNVCCPRNGKQVFIEQTVQPRHCATAWEGGRSLQGVCPEPVARIPARERLYCGRGISMGKTSNHLSWNSWSVLFSSVACTQCFRRLESGGDAGSIEIDGKIHAIQENIQTSAVGNRAGQLLCNSSPCGRRRGCQ